MPRPQRIPLGNIQQAVAQTSPIGPGNVLQAISGGFSRGGRDAAQMLKNEAMRRNMAAAEDALAQKRAEEAADAQAAMFALGGAPAAGAATSASRDWWWCWCHGDCRLQRASVYP